MKYIILEKAYKKPRTTVQLKTSSKVAGATPKIPKTKKRRAKASGMSIGTGQIF